jgi:hypothetical protein
MSAPGQKAKYSPSRFFPLFTQQRSFEIRVPRFLVVSCRPVVEETQSARFPASPRQADAKALAREIVENGWRANAGTLNPHHPKRVISLDRVLDWIGN